MEQIVSSSPELNQKLSVMYMVVVAILWGSTNPLIKKGAHGIETIVASTIISKFFKQIVFLLKSWTYLIPFFINQCGSILYVSNLGTADLSLSVPVTNGLTFAVTALTGWILREEKLDRNVYAGIILIFLGSTVCCLEKFIA